MKKRNLDITRLMIFFLSLVSILTKCPNDCSGHGICNLDGRCTCFNTAGLTKDGQGESFTGNDCSMRKCPVGNPFSAVYSPYPSNQDDTSPNVQVPEVEATTERILDTTSSNRSLADSQITVTEINGDSYLYYLTNFTNSLIKELGKYGGILKCHYESDQKDRRRRRRVLTMSKGDIIIADVKKWEEKNKIINSYIQFDVKIHTGIESPTLLSESITIESVICDKIISTRTDWSLYNPTAASVINDNKRVVRWSNYGKILYDLGLFGNTTTEDKTEDDEEKTIYKYSKKVKMACTKQVEYNKELKIYDDVDAEITPTSEKVNYKPDDQSHVEFTITTTDAIENYICFLLGESEVNIENTNLGVNVRDNKIGKYNNNNEGINTQSTHTVIILSSSDRIESNTITTSVTDADKYLNINRTVYLSVINNNNNKIYEVSVRIIKIVDQIYTFIPSLPLSTASFLPYIRLFPTDSANLQNQLLDETSHLYKLNIGIDFITSLQSPEIGGLLECTKDSDSMIIDVKGYKLDEENSQPIYSFVKFNEKIGEGELKPEVERRLLLDDFGMKGMSCKAIFGRNDLSFLNPIKPINKNTIIWTGYKPILQNMNFKINNQLSFACLKDDNNEFIIINTNNTKYSVNDIKFTIESLNDNNIDITKYICYLLSDSKGNNMNILDTDLGKNVRISNNTYYLGKYTSNDLDIITNQEDDNTIIVFKNDEKNIIEKADIKSNYKGIEDYLLVDRTIYLSILLDNNIIIEKQVVIESQTGDSDFTFKFKEPINELLYNDKNFIYYIRTYPICRLSSLPLPFIKGDALDNDSKFWIVYNLISKIKVSSISDVGGIIQCGDLLEADIKGKVENETNAFYILFNNKVEKSNIHTYKCDKYITKRKDLSLYYSFHVKKESGRRILEDESITVETDINIYSKLLYNMGFFHSELVKIEEEEFYQITVNMSCMNDNLILIYPNVLISTKSSLTEKVSLTFLSNYTALLTSTEYNCNILSDSKGNLLDILDTDLGINIRKSKDDTYVIGKYELPAKDSIKTDIENGFLVIILPDESIKSNKITIPTENLEKNKKVELYLEKGQFIYIPIRKNQVIREHSAKIKKVEITGRLLSTNTEITINPPIPDEWNSLGIIRTNPTDEGIKENIENEEVEEVVEKEPLKVLDDSINLYIVNKNDSSTIYDLSIKLPKVGGILQCQYTSDSDNIIYKGSVDVKSYSTDNIYAEFKGGIYKKNPSIVRSLSDAIYNINNVICDKILSTRNDLSLINPQSVKNMKITWIGYKVIFESLYLPDDNNNDYNISFACYTPSSLNQITVYDSNITVKIDSNNYVFTFTNDLQSPSDGDICFLLSDINGKNITIEESDLFSTIRLGKNDNYYFGKYVSVNNNTLNVYHNDDDGSTVLTIGRDISNTSNIDISCLKDGYLKMNLSLIYYSNSLLSLITPGTRMSIYELYRNGRKVFIGSVQIMKILNDENTITLDLSDRLLVKDFEKIPDDRRRRRRMLVQTVPDDVIGYELVFDTAETTHIPIECSGQGECNRETGQCNCYKGFEGSACQRLSCPNNCNGNGRCVPLRELLSNIDLKRYTGYGNSQTDENNKVFPDLVFGCLCDSGTRGADCSLKECPSGIDPLDPNSQNVEVKRDCSGRGICNYESGKCECFDGFVGQACQIMSSII